ncbi:hypothetical protein Tco_0343197 [Tanacetum coccineum]
MAISVISISSDSSEDSVGTPAGRVILFGTIPTTIPDTTPVITPPATQTDTPVIPTETPIIAPTIPPSPDYTPASPDYSPASDSESDPSFDFIFDFIYPFLVVNTIRFKIRGLVLKKTPDVVKASEISDFPIDRRDYYRDMGSLVSSLVMPERSGLLFSGIRIAFVNGYGQQVQIEDKHKRVCSRFRRHLNRKRETRKFLNNSIDIGLYVFKEIKPIENEDPRPETKDDLTGDNLKQFEADTKR